MKILKRPISVEEMSGIAAGTFGDMVKAVVDVGRELIALDGELHSDLEALLLENGSAPGDLWGINFYPGLAGDDFLEFDSMINMRPSRGNPSRGVDSEETRRRIASIADRWVKR